MEIRIEDFPLLFGSAGICRDATDKFAKILQKLDLLNQKATELQKEVVNISNKAELWLEKDLSAEAVDYYSKGINELYPTETPPDDQAFDTTYQERYAIGHQFVSGRKNCREKMQECIELCNEPDRLLKGSETRNTMKLALRQLSELNSLAEKILNNPDSPEPALNKTMQMQMTSLFSNIDSRLEIYQDDITASKEMIRVYHELLDTTEVQFNRIRLGRTPAYSDQAQNCAICDEPYAYLKWCKFCDRNQFKKQFTEWTSGNTAIDKFIHQVQLSINHPNCYAEWIPYEQFTNINFIGKGGFATVYYATWTNGLGIWDYALGKRVRRQNTPVALKHLRGSQHVDPNFFEEVAAHMKILSSRVLHCYGISKEPKTQDYIMVLPYAHGGDLLHYLKKRWKRLKWTNKLDILRHLTYGIVDIHSKGRVHHDIHPGNLFHYQKLLAVADLGLCRPANEKLSENMYGVINYAAPEYICNNLYTQAADVYSIGMIMWLLVSGEPPFSNRKSDLNLALDVCKGRRPKIVEGTPSVYAELMQKCWNADKNERPTAEEVYIEIKNWLSEISNNPSSKIAQQFADNSASLNGDINIRDDANHTSQNLSEISKSVRRLYNQRTYDNAIGDFNDSFESLNSLSPPSIDAEEPTTNVEVSRNKTQDAMFENHNEIEKDASKVFDHSKFGENNNGNIGSPINDGSNDNDSGDSDNNADDDVWNSVQERDFLSWLSKDNV